MTVDSSLVVISTRTCSFWIQRPLTSLFAMTENSLWSRLSTTRRNFSSRESKKVVTTSTFGDESDVKLFFRQNLFSDVSKFRSFELSSSAVSQKIPPGNFSRFLQQASTASVVFPIPPRPQTAKNLSFSYDSSFLNWSMSLASPRTSAAISR